MGQIASMKRKHMTEEKLNAIMEAAAPEIQKRTAAATEMATDIGQQIMTDQAAWLDDLMRDILPPNLYEEGKRGRMEELIGAYLEKHKIKVVFIPDHLVLRIMIGDRVHSQFVPKITLDGQPVEMKSKSTLDGSRN